MSHDIPSSRTTGELRPYFHDGSPPSTNAEEAFLRVSVFEAPNSNGYVGVYLASGTYLAVQGDDLVRLDEVVSKCVPSGGSSSLAES